MNRPAAQYLLLSCLALAACGPEPAGVEPVEDLSVEGGAELNDGSCRGNIDVISVNGAQRRVQGWAFNGAKPSSGIWVHFYSGGPAGQGGTYVGGIYTTASRPDVNTAFGITGVHGFDFTWTSPAENLAPGTYTKSLYVHAINDTTNPVVAWKTYPVTVGGGTAPVVYFDSSASWPPLIYNNPDLPSLTTAMPAGRYVAPFFGQLLEGTKPVQSTATIASIASYTGLGTNPVTLFTPAGPADVRPFSFIQLDHSTKTLGMWLNSRRLDGNYGLTTVTPAVRLATPARPWAEANAMLSLSWYMRLPVVHTDDLSKVVPYMVNYVVLRLPSRGLKLWYGSSAYDARGYGIPAVYTGYDRGTQMGIFTERLTASATAVQPGPNSSQYQSLPFSDERYFDIVVSRANLRTGLAKYNLWAAANASPQWPTDDASLAAVEVSYLGLNPELWDGSSRNSSPDANGYLGSTYRAIRLRKVY